jgi:hypothetical protein
MGQQRYIRFKHMLNAGNREKSGRMKRRAT